MELVWSWYGIGVELVWSWYGVGMKLVWNYEILWVELWSGVNTQQVMIESVGSGFGVKLIKWSCTVIGSRRLSKVGENFLLK